MIFNKLIEVRLADKLSRKGELLDSIALSNDVRKELLTIIFDKDVRFYVDTKKILQGWVGTGGLIMQSVQELEEELLMILKSLAKREVTGNAAISVCNDFADKLMSYETLEMFTDILDNKTRLGIKATNIAKYCNEFRIDQYEVMYALAYKKVKNLDWRKKYVAQPKIDGNRQIFEKSSYIDQGRFFSRTGKLTTSLEKISQDILYIFGPGPYVMDGEVENGTLEETGFIRRKNEQADNAIYTIFGIYDYNEWSTKQHTEKYEQTLNIMKKWEESSLFKECHNIRMIPSFPIEANTEEEFHKQIQFYMNKFVEQGYEGVVIKTLDHVYQPSAGTRRSKDWIKIKPEEDADGFIIDIIEGDGLDRGKVGKFNVKWMNETFEVSPGKINHEMRKFMFENQHLYIGQKLEFKYQELSMHGVPRNAYGVKIRED